MDNLEYLKQISQSNRPVQKPAGKTVETMTIVKIVVGGLVVFFLLMAIGALLGSLGGKTENLTKQLYLRTTNLNSVLTTYNKEIKSSNLRSLGVSLAGTLTNATNQLTTFILADSNDKDGLVPNNKTVEEETTNLNELTTSLNNAQLNGILDRDYANQIGLQVSLLLALISQLDERSNDEELRSFLANYSASLETIHQGFENFADLGV